MNSDSVGGFAHAINRFFEWIGVSPAFTSYVSSLSTSAYGFLSLNEFLGIAALWVALDRNASLRAALAVVEAKISTHKEVQGYEDAARKATDAALIDLLSTD